MSEETIICCICDRVIIPHPKAGKRQKTCGDERCRKEYKKESNARWRKENPDHWKDDYPRVKGWLDLHPGYLKQYRGEHPEYVQKNRDNQRLRDHKRKVHLDIQAKLNRQPSDIVRIIETAPQVSRLDIQADLIMQPIEVTLLLSHLFRIAPLDIQDKMEFTMFFRDNRAIKTGGDGYGRPMDRGS